ncbi:MAG TPA: lysylphosphatidylglycerol synthase transmembrane domain-containing protein [Methylomirabilota bacterium]|nr:lysylphosphatidylglycerol synthase transmembrane domain-containing protein [Methylomirabilota bacterium]
MSTSRKIWSLTWRLGVCGLLLFWIFHSIFTHEAQQLAGDRWEELDRREQWAAAWSQGPVQLWNTLRLIHPVAFVASLGLMGCSLAFGIWRWRVIMKVQGIDLPLPRAAEISLVAHFFNSFLLGSTGGDLMKAYYAARETHHKKTEAVVTVFADRLVGFWSMLFFASIMMALNFSLVAGHDVLRTLAVVILAMLFACSLLAGLAFWGGVTRGWSGARGWLRRLPKGAWLERLLDSCRQFGRAPRFLFRAVCLSMALNAVCVLQVWVLAAGLNLDVPPRVWWFVVPAIISLSALPITPSGLGVRENLFVLVLASERLGVSETSALSLSLLAYAGSLFWSLVGGGVYLTLRNRRALREVARVEAVAENA